jgi:hypothetical protein
MPDSNSGHIAVPWEPFRAARALAITSAIILMCCGHSGIAADDNGQTKRVISLSLEAVDKTVKRGAIPKFRLTIRNTGRDRERVLDLRGGRRVHLQDTYFDLEVTAGEREVDLPRAITDPGPISDKDWVTLEPGEAVMLDLSHFAAALDTLPPGRYKARVRFWQNPGKSAKTSFASPPAEFVVSE